MIQKRSILRVVQLIPTLREVGGIVVVEVLLLVRVKVVPLDISSFELNGGRGIQNLNEVGLYPPRSGLKIAKCQLNRCAVGNELPIASRKRKLNFLPRLTGKNLAVACDE